MPDAVPRQPRVAHTGLRIPVGAQDVDVGGPDEHHGASVRASAGALPGRAATIPGSTPSWRLPVAALAGHRGRRCMMAAGCPAHPRGTARATARPP